MRVDSELRGTQSDRARPIVRVPHQFLARLYVLTAAFLECCETDASPPNAMITITSCGLLGRG
jgi:hypothetical protein